MVLRDTARELPCEVQHSTYTLGLFLHSLVFTFLCLFFSVFLCFEKERLRENAECELVDLLLPFTQPLTRDLDTTEPRTKK